MFISRSTCRRKCNAGCGFGLVCIVLLLVGGLILNAWAGSIPLRNTTLEQLPDAPVLSTPSARQLPAATLEEGDKPKCFARAFQRLSAWFESRTTMRPFRPSHAGDGPAISIGIGPFFQTARLLALLRVDLPPP